MNYFPVFLDLNARECLVVGGGDEASHRAATLRSAGARVSIVAHTLCPALRDAVRQGEIAHLGEHFTPCQLDGMTLVMVADESLAVNEAVSQAARDRTIPVNVMDEPAFCSFILPAIVDRSPVVVAIGTGGTAPALARVLRLWLDQLLPAKLGRLAIVAGRFRSLVKRRVPGAHARRRLWEHVLTGEVAVRALAGEEAAAGAALLDAIDRASRGPTSGNSAAA